MVNDHKIKKLNHGNTLVMRKRQQGIVLIVSLVFLIALTAVGAALMQNTTTDMKMSGASQEKSVALQEAISELDHIIYNQVRRVNGTNGFTLPLSNYPHIPTVDKGGVTSADIIVTNEYDLDAHCPASFGASSVREISCNMLRVRLTRQYGRENNSNIDINSGIAQQVPSGGRN